MSPYSLLVVEDEDNLLEALRYSLEQEHYLVYTAKDGKEALETIRLHSPDLVILDVMLPKIDGLELCRIVRRESDIRLLMLTAKGEEADRIAGLELGADDYVVKPFSMRELLARVRALLRRHMAEYGRLTRKEVIAVGDLVIDLEGQMVTKHGMLLPLKPKEFALLALFATHKGRAFTRDEILDQLWGQDYVGDKRTVDVHVRGLRKKIEKNPETPTVISTVRGAGYRFNS